MKSRLIKFIILLLCLTATSVSAQNILEHKLDGSESGKPLSIILEKLSAEHAATFYYLPEWIEPISIQQSYDGQTLGDVLTDMFIGTDLSFFSMYPNVIVIIKDPTQVLLRRDAIETAIRQQKSIDRYAFGELGKSKINEQVIITGNVKDGKTKEGLPLVTIQVSDSKYSTTTDEAGNYKLILAPGVYVLDFSFVDYENKVIDLLAYESGEITLELDEKAILLDEVIIRDQTTRESTTSRIGLTQLSIQELKRSPVLLGEVDLVKQIQTLPGVTTVGESAAGFNVRGGSVDQNLILYDGLPVFGSSHVFGFLSAFNSEALRDVSFYRGGIPVEYGGRVSSVLDIRSKDGSLEKWNGNAGIGMITSNVMINGPLKKGKTTLAASLRSTYSDWLVRAIRTDYADLRNSSVFFYDGTLKLTHLISNKTKLSFTGYSSKDAFRLTGDTTYRWNNLLGSVRLDHQFNPKLNSEFIMGLSNYRYSVTNADPQTASELSFAIRSLTTKAGFNYQTGKHRINFGWQLIHYGLTPGSVKPDTPESNVKSFALDDQHSIENAFYVADGLALTDKLFVEAGIRLPLFFSFGLESVNIYKEGMPRDLATITDTLHFGKAKIVKGYSGLEPRVSFRWMVSQTASFKLGYNRMYQFLHLVTNTTAVTPVDIWQPSGYYFKPQRADQISLGFFKDFSEKKYGVSAEVFYKSIDNILDFKDGAQLLLNNHLETDLLQGKGESYGIETSFSKNLGRLSGTLNYTYSRSFRLISGSTSVESINDSKRYPSSFDQPHILNFSWKYNLSKRFFFTGNFTYHTGRPVTIPLSAFVFENTTAAYFSQRNQYRIPDYHRLDIALVIEGNNKRKSKVQGTWVFSLYNVYARKNPYTVFFKSSGNGVPQPYQLSIVGTVLPSISYNLKF